MEEKCFCHFNGYKVKDADARKSVEQLKGEMAAQTAEYEALQKNVHSKTNEMQQEVDAAFSAAQQAARDAAEAKKRADQMSTMEEGSTTGDAELQDIRIGADGVTYNNAGNAVRSQGYKLDNLIRSLPLKTGMYDITNSKWASSTICMGMRTPMYAEEDLLLECPANYNFRVLYFTSADPASYSTRTGYLNRFIVRQGKYFDVHFQNIEGTTITVQEAYNLTIRKVYTMPEIDAKIAQSGRKLVTFANENKLMIEGEWEFGALFQSTGLENEGSSSGGYIRTGFIDIDGIDGTVVLEIVSDAYDGGGDWQARVYEYDSAKVFLKVTQKLAKGAYPIALQEGTRYIRLMCGNYVDEDIVTLENGSDVQLYKVNPMLEEIKKIAANGGTVYEDEVDATVAAVQAAMYRNMNEAGENTYNHLLFAIFTDLHHDPENPMDPMKDMFANMKALHERLHFDAIFNLGDSIDGTYYDQATAEKYHAAVKTAARAITPNYYALEGNHDNNVQSTWESKGGFDASEKLTNMELHMVMQRGAPGANNMGYQRATDFMVDFSYRLRVICISAEYTTYQQDTVEFLLDALSDAGAEHIPNVLLLSHCATRPELGFNNDISNGELVEAELEHYQQNGGVLVGHINGHTHGDIMLGIQTHAGGYKNISIGCAKFEKLSGGTPGATYQPRNANDHTKVLFDVVLIDTAARTVDLIRFGAGDDRHYSY